MGSGSDVVWIGSLGSKDFQRFGTGLGPFGNLWISLEIFGNLWKYLEIFGILWGSLEIFGNLWESLESLGIFGTLWKFQRFPKTSKDAQRYPKIPNGAQAHSKSLEIFGAQAPNPDHIGSRPHLLFFEVRVLTVWLVSSAPSAPFLAKYLCARIRLLACLERA